MARKRSRAGFGALTLAVMLAVSNGTDLDAGRILALLSRGWAIAVTGYEGLGTPGQHTYMVGPSMGHATLDVLRAATRLPGTGLAADAPMTIWGYSQGGAAAAWAAQLQPSYAPELNLKGPMLLYHAQFDEIIPYHLAITLRDQYCAAGVIVQWQSYPVEHLAALAEGAATATLWLAGRFANRSPVNTCPTANTASNTPMILLSRSRIKKLN